MPSNLGVPVQPISSSITLVGSGTTLDNDDPTSFGDLDGQDPAHQVGGIDPLDDGALKDITAHRVEQSVDEAESHQGGCREYVEYAVNGACLYSVYIPG